MPNEPGTAGGTARESAVTVATAMSPLVYLFALCAWPAVTMFGLRSVPSRKTWCVDSAWYWYESTVSVTFMHRSMSCSPSGRISGSTIGTRPFCKQQSCLHTLNYAMLWRCINGQLNATCWQMEA